MEHAMNGYAQAQFEPSMDDGSPFNKVFRPVRDTESPFARVSISAAQGASSRRPISPPPLKRTSTGAASTNGLSPDLSSVMTPTSEVLTFDKRLSPAEPWKSDVRSRTSAVEGSPSLSHLSHRSTPLSPHRANSQQVAESVTRTARSSTSPEWTVPQIAERLTQLYQKVKNDHAKLTNYVIESTKASEWRVQSGADLFAGINMQPSTEKQGIRAKFKQHSKKREHREEYYKPICIKTSADRVPRYRFHHVEIKKNVLAPHTSLTFYPHLRDLKSSEERKYNLWLKELEEFDLQSGFKPMNREEKAIRTAQSERARTLSLYLEGWLRELSIPGCNKSTLIQCMARREPDDAITPQQKTDILKSQHPQDGASPTPSKAAEMFSDAFRQVFEEGQPSSKHILLRDVLFLDESVDNIMDSKPTAKDGSSPQNENEDDLAESNLATYCILGCLICFSHSCEHGEYDNTNCKHTFSISSSRYRLRDVLSHRRRPPYNQPATNGDAIDDTPCHRNCYRSITSARPSVEMRPFSEDETVVLRSLYATMDHGKVNIDPICLAADFLNRDCQEVHTHFESLELTLPPPPEPATKPPTRGLSWYDRHKKMLMGDWQDHTVSHEHQRRDVIEPCFHDGPCAPKVCSCVDAGVLCERFCGCTLETCVHKFNGCACHSQGKICQRKQGEKSSCICVQLNRECDPTLCGPCGAFQRADPENANDEVLHSTGCQNCELQRGVSKALLLGQSQLEGVGYGLFTAEDIAQDEFVVEYVGELIVHDEGVRREARRGDVFNEESTISYLFTLLENEGIWVDAAQYGNLSRYINHAPESEKRGCNITPRILYVNGEFRIKFTALRDIKAGEELFFNYGDEFPNLTKKLLDNKAGEASGTPRRKTNQQARASREDKTSRKATKPEPRKPGRPRIHRKESPSDDEEERVDRRRSKATASPKASRKRKRQLDSSDEEDYHPNRHTDSRSGGAAAISPRLRERMKSNAKARLSGGTHTPQRDQPKTRGKRGGARPGSGRPRKHPRPVPAATPSAAAAGTPTTPTVNGTSAQETASKTPEVSKTPQDAKMETIQKLNESREIEDSFDDRSGFMDEDGEDEDEDEDDDVVIRKRQDRATRNRRPPKKYRESAESDT